MKILNAFIGAELLIGVAVQAQSEPTWESLADAFVLAPPTEDIVIKTLASKGVRDGEIVAIDLLRSNEEIEWKRSSDALSINLPKTLPGKNVNGFRLQFES